jgi:hypothetical protein
MGSSSSVEYAALHPRASVTDNERPHINGENQTGTFSLIGSNPVRADESLPRGPLEILQSDAS